MIYSLGCCPWYSLDVYTFRVLSMVLIIMSLQKIKVDPTVCITLICMTKNEYFMLDTLKFYVRYTCFFYYFKCFFSIKVYVIVSQLNSTKS